MAPIHIFVWVSALLFQVGNGVSIGGWLGGYGPTTSADWATARRPAWLVPLGIAIWAVGLAGNIYHDDVLRAIRRDASRKKPAPKKTPVKKGRATGAAAAAAKKKKEAEGKEEKKVYAIPEGGLFGLVLYAHYFCEWVEWCGFWLVGGMACIPARNFVLNELATMLPRAWNGWFWYVDRFGRERIGDRKAAIPFLI
jgi:3-oxo-5-alpha-steroid 4-dehydrogenase 1